MECKTYCVYKHSTKWLNTENVYIGQTKGDPKKRWYSRGGKHGYKHGKCGIAFDSLPFDTFWMHEVIHAGLTRQQADVLETIEIIKHDAVRRGLNSNYGKGLRYVGLSRADVETDPAAAVEVLEKFLESIS